MKPVPWVKRGRIAAEGYQQRKSALAAGNGPPLTRVGKAALRLRPATKVARQKFAAVTQTFGIDTVTDAGGQMPFHRHPERS